MKLMLASILVLLTMTTFCGIEEPKDDRAETNSVKGFWHRVVNLRFSCMRFLMLFADDNTFFSMKVNRCPFLPERFVTLTDDAIFAYKPDDQDENYPGQKSSYRPDSLITVLGNSFYGYLMESLSSSYPDLEEELYVSSTSMMAKQKFEEGKTCYPILITDDDFFTTCFLFFWLGFLVFEEDPAAYPWTSRGFWRLLIFRYLTAYYTLVISTVFLCVLLN